MIVDDIILYKKYNINIEDFNDIMIDFDALKIRTSNCLKRAGIFKIHQLLSMSHSKLLQIHNMGLSSLEDIEQYILQLNNTLNERQDSVHAFISDKIMEKRNLIFKGEFIDELYEGLNEKEVVIVNTFKEGHKLMDGGMINSCRENPNSVLTIFYALNRYVQNTAKYSEFYKLYNVLENKINNFLKPYFDVYSVEANISSELYQYCEDNKLILSDLFNHSGINDSLLEEKTDFAKWLSYNLYEEVKLFLDSIYSRRSDNTKKIIEMRSKKQTLQVIGDQLGITRERVRQIEKKVVKPFCEWQRRNKFLPRLSAEFNGKKILEATDLLDYFGEITEIVLYLLQCADDEFFSYDRDTDTIIIVDDDVTDFVRNYIEKMPNELDIDEVAKYRQRALTNYDISEDVFNREIFSQYRLSGTLYHRHKLSLEKIYQIVLKKYYPDGMNIYDETELKRFRDLIYDEFGDVSLPQNNRAISATVARCCILCGRGRYRARDSYKTPHELIARVYRYIMDSDRNLFFMNEIFIEFEQELRDVGIDNRYFLQGVLREEYDNELFFKRDYVSKDSNNLSLDREIKFFIKKSRYPVTKEQIRGAFPGITEIMLSMAVMDANIINYRGAYIHSSNLNLYDYDKIYITNIVEHVICDGFPHHCGEIYEAILNDNPELLNRLGIYYQYSLFSLLQFFFRDSYVFERPYLAHEGVNINKPIELMEEYLSVNDLFEITELLELAREYRYTIYDILKFLNEWNETHLLINKREMASVEYIGLTEDIARDVEGLILEEIGEQALVTELACVYKLPRINIPWNEWLVYSVVNRWGVQLEAHTTSSQFRHALPIVSRKGKFNRENYNGTENGRIVNTVDLNDMDAVTDYIMEDFDIEW